MKLKKSQDKPSTSKTIYNYINKDTNNCLENEIAIIIKKIKKEINVYNKIYKNHKLDLMQTMNEYEIENNKYKKINNKISELEKEVELNYKMINKIKKKKIYAISSILKFKKLYKKENLEQFKSLLNIGLNGPKDNYDYFDIIKESDKEFNYYLSFLEKYYKSLKNDNIIEFIQKKNFISISINSENLSFPEEKLLFYLSYVLQIIDLEDELNKKTEELKKEEIKRIELNTKIKNLGILKNEQKNFIADANDYIELLKSMIQKYSIYQKKYKNNLISKETFYKKIRKLQSMNLQNFQMDNNTSKNNNNIMNESIKSVKSFFPRKTRHLIFISKRKNKLFTPNFLESKSQNISRNISTDYLPKVEPLEKKYIFEKNETSLNDIFFKMSKGDDDISENVNISENSDYVSPVSTINITSRKISFTTNPISTKTTIQNNKIKDEIPVFDFNINNNNLVNINNNQNINTKVPNNIYCKKKLNFNCNIKNEIKASKTKVIINDNTKTILKRNKILIDNKNLKLPKKENKTINCNKSVYFLKKINRNKQFFINKDKLFNKNLAKTLAVDKIKLNKFHKEILSKQKMENNSNNNELNNHTERFDVNRLQNCKTGNLINNKSTKEVNSYCRDNNINQKKFNYNNQSIKDGLKQNKYLYYKKNKIRMQRTLDIRSDIPTENCCFSCL